jgi:hypothetical protein
MCFCFSFKKYFNGHSFFFSFFLEHDRLSLPQKSYDRKVSAMRTPDLPGCYVKLRSIDDYNHALNYQRAMSSKYASSREGSSSSDDAEI